MIKNPTSIDDMLRDTVWILDVIDTKDKSKFLIKRVENRKSETIYNTLKEIILPGGTLKTDGHPSYPSVAANLALEHKIVNHDEGFFNEYGESTNIIDAFWCDLKATMRKENGVKRLNIGSRDGEVRPARLYLFVPKAFFEKIDIPMVTTHFYERRFCHDTDAKLELF